MSGTSATHFSPNEPTTRAMLVTILYRAAGQPETTGQSSFADVLARDYFANAVAWASENNIVTGYSRTRFGSNDPVSREQIATLLWRYAGSPSAGAHRILPTVTRSPTTPPMQSTGRVPTAL